MEEETIDILKFKLSSSEQNKVLYTDQIKEQKNIIISTERRIKQLDDAKNILTILKNHKMESKKVFILKTINTALGDVFDQNLRLDIEAMSSTSTGKINMKYDIVLYQNDIEMARNEKLLVNNGGGVLSFISILFKILVGYIYSDNKFFLFDESISQVSPRYRPKLARFLQKFCKEYAFTIVLISQTDDIDDYADVGYYLDGAQDDKGVPILKIDKILGTYPEEDYVYTKIENFQSIVKQEFRYKGFTVIRGGNNIGKSASFRAVNAILFNTFDAKSHPRKLTIRGSETKIEFGFFKNKDKIIKINLSFKTNKVVYEFDGLTYTGKSLAFDKIKEKVESIGFKYVNLKDTYKNFKGNLKDQTERLAMTTQHDGFYLVGNKNNETEKVFNFLFDSTAVANAISQVNNDILSCKNLLEVSTNKLSIDTFKLKQENILYEILLYKYYYLSIIDYISAIDRIKILTLHKVYREDIIANIRSYEVITTNLISLSLDQTELIKLKSNNLIVKKNVIDKLINDSAIFEQLNKMINFLKLKEQADKKRVIIKIQVQNINQQIIISEEILAFDYYHKAINSYLQEVVLHNNYNHIKKIIEQKKNIYDDIIILLANIANIDISILNYKTDISKLIDLKETHYNKLNDLSNLDKEYNIQECIACNGTGYTHLHIGELHV